MALQSEYLVPAGAILLWSGTLANIPAGWVLCNGANGTPDLRDKFVKGASNAENPGATGGNLTHTHTIGSIAASGTSAVKVGTSASNAAASNHTHAAPSCDSPNHEPPYYKVAFIMKS